MSTPAGWYNDGSGRQRWWNGQQWTDQYQLTADRLPRSSGHLWWALSPLYSFGLIPFIPALHAAIKLKRRDLWLWAGGLIVGSVIAWTLMGIGPSNPDGSNTAVEDLGATIALVMALLGTIQAFRTRNEVFGQPQAAVAANALVQLDPAIADALAQRKRREEALALCVKDPGLARDLMIGRPDLNRQYDDGGLVDVNHAPAAALVTHLGFSQDQASSVVQVRDHIGRFESIDDLSVTADLPPRLLDDVRDRIVIL